MPETFSVSPNDYKELASFLYDFEEGAKSREFWLNTFDIWWDKNPAFSNDIERGWLLRDKGRIVAFIGSLPSYFQVAGQKTRIFAITTWMVLPGFRNQSMGLLFKLLNAFDNSIVLDTTPTDIVAKTLKCFGFVPLPGYENKNSLVIINHEHFLLSKLEENPAAKALAAALSYALKIFQDLRLMPLKKAGVKNVKKITAPELSLDRLWERTKNLYANTNIRTAEMINWSCFLNKFRKKELFGYYENGELLGYLAAGAEKSAKLKILKCFDLWVEPSGENTVLSLINAVIEYAKENSFDCVVFPHFTKDLGVYFKKAGLLQGRPKESREYLKAPPEIMSKIRSDNSYFVELQGDRGMF